MTKPFYPTKSELPLLLDGRMTAIVRPAKFQPFSTKIPFPFGPEKTILWCKEPFHYLSDNALYNTREMKHLVNYRWDNEFEEAKELYWRSSVSMPKSACRLWLEVVEVKVCKLREAINGRDALEGVAIGEMFIEQYGIDLYESDPFVWIATVKRIEKP